MKTITFIKGDASSPQARGTWPKIEPLTVEHLCERDISVTVYDFEL